MSDIWKDYKGFTVHYDERSEEWYYEDYRDKSLKALCAALDKDVKANFDRREVFVKSSYGAEHLRPATMTSTLPGGRKAWVTFEDGSRIQVELTHVYANTPDNVAIVEDIEINHEAIKGLNKEIEDAVAKLRPFKL